MTEQEVHQFLTFLEQFVDAKIENARPGDPDDSCAGLHDWQ